ncbi:hypothetical protein P0Y35_11305 [Kiritimatiellaeota bacterium B1221]|nr:hypothetical protein [Kiritimatiellaeota bacterium B1221]
MKKLLLGTVIGFIFASALAVPVVLFVKNDKYKYGRNIGYLNGQAETFVFLRKHFQVTHPSKSISEMEDVLSTKAGNVYVLDVNGTLTIEIQ